MNPNTRRAAQLDRYLAAVAAGKMTVAGVGRALGVSRTRAVVILRQRRAARDREQAVKARRLGLVHTTDPVASLGLSARALAAAQVVGAVTVGDLAKVTLARLRGCRNFDAVSLADVREALADVGLTLKDDRREGRCR